MTPSQIRANLTEQGFAIIKCDPEPNGLFLVTVRAVTIKHDTILNRCLKAGLALERYGNIRGIDYLYVRPVAERLL